MSGYCGLQWKEQTYEYNDNFLRVEDGAKLDLVALDIQDVEVDCFENGGWIWYCNWVSHCWDFDLHFFEKP